MQIPAKKPCTTMLSTLKTFRHVQSENLKSKNKNLSEYESWHQQSAHLTNKQLRGSGVGQHSA